MTQSPCTTGDNATAVEADGGTSTLPLESLVTPKVTLTLEANADKVMSMIIESLKFNLY